MRLSFTARGWNDYLSWSDDRRTLRQIHRLIADIQRGQHAGLGKPEPLSGDYAGWWSRRIDAKHRLVYRIVGDEVEITQCRGHYQDR
ncbi:MAG: Txe/YoeB family addiction module toxin [Propionibacteriaceae bacterium]|nr:Txe/YoeB family addiction module toxin [Propionibacteriaceae bacterium]